MTREKRYMDIFPTFCGQMTPNRKKSLKSQMITVEAGLSKRYRFGFGRRHTAD